ncbi:MAG: hypothetical protein C0504_03385 [Candidatus Solibacter sp.]|nr:hypothetical protein [Candidatus Solibacter sp.]
MNTRNLIVLLIAFVALSATASATSINCQPPYCVNSDNVLFNLTGSGSYGSYGNVRTYTSDGLTMTVTSFGLARDQGATFQAAATGRWGGGLGVSDQFEGFSTSSYKHTVDNNGYYNFVLFQFDKPVDPLSLSITQYNGDSDVSYWSGNLTGPMIGQTLAGLSGLGFGGMYTNTTSGSRTFSLTSPTVNALLVAAKIGQSNDYFKIKDICVDYEKTPPPGEIPEPSTYATMGGALLGLGVFIARRRKKA